MSSYYRAYDEFCTKTMNAQSQTIADQINHYKIIEDLLGFHYWLYNKISPIYNQVPDYGIRHKSELFTDGAFSQNFLSLYTIFLTIERNLLHTARANMRTVLESIPKIFYLSFYPNEADSIFIHDILHGIRDENEKIRKLEKFKSDTKLDSFKRLNSNEIIEQIKGKYYFKWFVKEVYNEQTGQAVNNIYSSMSESTHPSFTQSQIQYDKERIDKMLRDTELLLFYNLVAEIEGHSNMIETNLFPFQESWTFMEKMRSMLVQEGRLVSLFPDHRDIVSRVRVHPPGSPWE